MAQFRKILFYIFVGIYFVFCPLTILYALGYIFQPGSEQGLVKTGIIYISTAPPGATVYLGNRRFTRKTPAVLRDLLPNDYSVSVYLKHHKLWTQTVPVEGEKATVLERILLLPDESKPERLIQGPFDDLIPLGDNPVFLLSEGKTLGDIFVCDWAARKFWPLVSETSPYRDARILSQTSVSESSRLFFIVQDGEEKKFLWVEPDAKGSVVTNLTHLFSEEPANVQWDPAKENHLFSFQDGRLHWVDVNSKTGEQKWFEGIRGYGLHEKMIYALKPDGTFVRMNHNGTDEEVLLNDPVLGHSLFGGEGFFDVKVFSKDIILFLGEGGELLANRLPYRFARSGIKGLQFDPKQQKVLIWGEERIGVLDFSKEERGDEKMFERGPELFWVFKKGVKIEQAFWVYEGSHILFRDEDMVYLLELETYGKPHLYELTRVRKKSSIFYAEDSGKLYYLDPESAALSTIEILPRRDLLLLPFPERKEKRKPSEIEGLS